MTIRLETRISRPGILMRILFRMPLIMYSIGLGRAMSKQMLLTTTGRRSGRPHEVVIDIVGHDKPRDMYYASAAFSTRSDWYLNLKANPVVRVKVGCRQFTARAITLPPGEAEDILVRFVSLHSRYVSVIMRAIGVRLSGSEVEVRNLASQMPVVAIQPEVA